MNKPNSLNNNNPKIMDALDALEDGIYIVNDDYVVEYMNKYMKDLFGEGTGKKCHKVLINSDTPCDMCKYKEVFLKNETHKRKIYIEHVDKTFEISEMPVYNSDKTKSKLSIYRDISRRILQEEKIASFKENYQRLFEHVGCGVFISSKKGRFLDVNPALLKMLDYKDKEEFLSLDLVKEIYLKPEDRIKYQKIIEKYGQVIDYEMQWRKKDKEIIHILLTSNVRYGIDGKIIGYEGVVVDQTRRKQYADRIKEAYGFLDNIISCSPNAVMAMDMDGTIKLWNQGAKDIFGYKHSSVIGKMNISQIFSKKVCAKILKKLRQKKFGGKGKLTPYSLSLKKKNNEIIEGNLSASIIYDTKGNESSYVVIFVDLIEVLQTERDLSSARQHLLQSEKLAAMGKLTSQIAHELNNPLFGIMNTLELLKTEIPPENKRRKLLDMSLSEVVRLADMLKKMLSFSTPSQDERLKVDINIIIEELMLLYEKKFKENSIKIKLDLAKGGVFTFASKDQLRQVFINIFSNAMYAMPDGGNLDISTKISGKMLYISIKDTGTGIKEKNKEKIFDSFFTTKKESVQGVGLGLSVCYGFIKDNGGDINFTSKEDKGTKFIIELPSYKT